MAHLARRQFLHLAAGAAVLPVVSRIAWAQGYPTPGGVADIVARLIGQCLSDRLGQPFITENRPGAGGNTGIEAVVRAASDGYTLLIVGPFGAINATLYDTLNYNFVRDIAPVASIVRVPNVLVVNQSVPAQTVPELIAHAKANPGKINMASGGIGTLSHMSGELFQIMAGVNMQHVPYRGGAPALTDLLAGQVQVYFASVPEAIEYIKAGKVRPLAVTSATRSDALPSIPTVADFVSGYEANGWQGVGAPKSTPTEIVAKLNSEINACFTDPKIKTRLGDFDATVMPGSPDDFGKLIAEETEKWARVVKLSGPKAD